MKHIKRRSKELRVGAVILLALAVIVATVFSIGGQKKLFGGKTAYKILFTSTSGLFEGDPVVLMGVEVGNVTNVGFPKEMDEARILVEINVMNEVAPRIRKDTRARLASASIVYGKIVQLSMGSHAEEPIPPNGYILADEQSTFGSIMDSTTLAMEEIRSVFSKINRGDGMVGMFMNETLEMRETLHNLSLASKRLADVLGRIDEGRGPLAVLMSDSVGFHETVDEIQRMSTDLEEVTTHLRGTQSVFGRLINDETYGKGLTDDLSSALKSLASITAKIDTGRGTLGSLINDDELYRGLADVVLGVQKSSLAKGIIRNRRKKGEKIRAQQDAATVGKQGE